MISFDRGRLTGWLELLSWSGSKVYCCGVRRVESSAKPCAALAYAVWAVLKFKKTSPIFSQIDDSGKLFPGKFS